MRVGIALPTLVDGDAVGNDVFGMARVLRGRGHDVTFFAWTSHISEPVKGPDDLPRMLNRPDDVLIYHHSIGCEWGVRAVERFPGRAAVKYHNVTPPEFFASANTEVAAGCALGVKQVGRLAKTAAAIWADSAFNAADFTAAVPGRAVAELPPFTHAEHLAAIEPDYRAVAGLDDWATNLLVVGRLVANKDIPLAVRTLAAYRAAFDPRARLIVVGDRPVPEHAALVDAAILDHKQEGHVLVTGKVTAAQLKALYLTADALLVTSKHEGFCVPLVEAMGLRLPVVAVPNAAVPATGGDAARYAPADPAALAAELHAVITDPEAREAQLERGRKRAGGFGTAAVAARFGELFDGLLASGGR